jgi:hypothetical protein
VYLSQYQLLPYERIREYFTDQLDIPPEQWHKGSMSRDDVLKYKDSYKVAASSFSNQSAGGACLRD